MHDILFEAIAAALTFIVFGKRFPYPTQKGSTLEPMRLSEAKVLYGQLHMRVFVQGINEACRASRNTDSY